LKRISKLVERLYFGDNFAVFTLIRISQLRQQ
jgi:hypothetical protein